MGKPKDRPKPMFSLAPVEFRTSAIAGRGVFAKKRFAPGDFIVAYAPKQRRLRAGTAEADATSASKVTLLTDDGEVIVPDTRVPGGWLCNHSCSPNAAIFTSGEGRIQCTRPIAPGEEVKIFYGWVSAGEPERDPCLCGAPECRGFINFDISDAEAATVTIDARGAIGSTSADFRARLEEYGAYLESIGQEQVRGVIAAHLAMRVTRG